LLFDLEKELNPAIFKDFTFFVNSSVSDDFSLSFFCSYTLFFSSEVVVSMFNMDSPSFVQVDAKKSGGIILIVSVGNDTLKITTLIKNSVDITSVRNKLEDISKRMIEEL